MAVVSPVPVPGPVPGESVLTESDASLLFGGARTAYTFTDEPVTDAQLQAIHELAKWAPTAVNAQPSATSGYWMRAGRTCERGGRAPRH